MRELGICLSVVLCTREHEESRLLLAISLFITDTQLHSSFAVGLARLFKVEVVF